MNIKHEHDICQEKIIAHFYMDDQLSKSDLDDIKTCDVCTEYFKQIKIMSATDIVNQPDEHYWDHYFERLEDRMDQEKNNIINMFGRISTRYIVAAAIVLVFIGFNIGKALYKPVHTSEFVSNIDAMEIQSLMTRSKVLFTQFNQLDEFNARFFLEEQIDQSKDILSLATYLRHKHDKNPILSKFIGDLEKVLISMKSIEDENIFAIQSIQNELKQDHLIAKLEYIKSKEVE